jgi:hypothetical protein
MWTELTGEQIGRERMRFFERLKAAASAEWRVYTEHPFTNAMADGLLAEAAFRHYLVRAGVCRRTILSEPLRRSRRWPIRAMCSTRECAAICWRSRWHLPPA